MGATCRERWRGWMRWHVQKRYFLWTQPRRPVVPIMEVAGWYLPQGLGPQSICYCGGIGEDARLELALAHDLGCRVVAFDPTPRAIAYLDRQPNKPAHFQFLPYGLWSHDEVLRFHAPADAKHVSHSIVEKSESQAYFEAPCRSIKSIMQELGDTRIDLLKLNIEGAEYTVLEAMLKDEVFPGAIAVAFEGGQAFRQARRWIRHLRTYGYEWCRFHSWVFLFVRRAQG